MYKYPTMEEMVQNKVNELIEKYKIMFYGRNSLPAKRKAIKCALIVCDEMLNEGKMIYAGNGIEDANYKFWVQVKDQLKLKQNQ